jgi:tetratricopeptide (TPR) repeat protein
MGPYSTELTPADAVARQAVFQQEFAELLGCQHLTILPPFPDYSLLSQNHSPKALLKAVNEVVLSRRPAYNQQLGWLMLPLIQSEKVIGVLLAEDIDEKYEIPENLLLLERLTRLCLEKLQWEKLGCRDPETMLWRREVLMRELNSAIDLAENGGSLTPRRLLSDNPGETQFTLICFAVNPAPESWAGAGPVWAQLGPQVVDFIPSESTAAHLGGGYLGIFLPKADTRDIQIWTERLLDTLRGNEAKSGSSGEGWDLVAGIANFPEDFYDEGPSLPWEKSDIAGRLAAAEEVIRRATLAADLAQNEKDEKILSYHTLRERGLVPKRESAIEKLLSSFFTNEEPGAFLMVKVDDWKVWQGQHGSKEAARRANKVLEVSEGNCPPGAIIDWAGPDRFGVFLPDAVPDMAEELAHIVRQEVKSSLSTTVRIGLSVHPCPGFAKRDMLENARKALVHTGFFGPNTQTIFDAVSLNISGDRLYESGRMEEAVQEFHRALALDAHNVNVRNSLGVCYAQMGKFAEAVDEFSRVIELEPNDFMSQYNLGCALLSLKREEEAERALSQAAALEPDNATVYFQLAKMCQQQSRLEDALIHLRRAVDLKPNWAQAWRLFGECLIEQGDDVEAMNGFKKALKINGKDAAALSGLAIVYGRSEANLEIALSLARRSVELEPDNPLFSQRLAELLLQNRELAQALAECKRAIDMAPEDEAILELQEKITSAQRASTS